MFDAVAAELKDGSTPFVAMAPHECPGMFTGPVPGPIRLVRTTRADGAVAYGQVTSPFE